MSDVGVTAASGVPGGTLGLHRGRHLQADETPRSHGDGGGCQQRAGPVCIQGDLLIGLVALIALTCCVVVVVCFVCFSFLLFFIFVGFFGFFLLVWIEKNFINFSNQLECTFLYILQQICNNEV